MLDRSFRGVGRIKKATGTTNPAVRRKISRMLTALHDDGRLDLLRAIRDGKLTALEVYDAYQRKTLSALAVGDTLPLLSAALTAWIEDVASDFSDKHIINHITAQRRIAKHDATARVADLPRMLDELRKTYGKTHPRSFNLMRATALSFTRSTLKRSHPLYMACLAVEERSVPKRPPGVQLSPDAMRERFPASDGKVDRIAWSLATTGMGAKEYWGVWSTLADRIHVSGTKRGGRNRDIPLVREPDVPPLSRDRFEKLFRQRMKDTTITPYHLRRTYSQWLESAGVPRTRRRLYMGHGAKDVTDFYERHEVDAFLAEDAAKLRTFIASHTKTHTVPSEIVE